MVPRRIPVPELGFLHTGVGQRGDTMAMCASVNWTNENRHLEHRQGQST